jgi:hypothetical protein
MIQAGRGEILQCFVRKGFKGVHVVALWEDSAAATIAQRRLGIGRAPPPVSAQEELLFRFDSMTKAPPGGAEAFKPALVSSLVEAGLSSDMLALLTVRTDLGARTVAIRGPQGALRSVRQATGGSLQVAGLIGRATSRPMANVVAYHVSVVVRCLIACPLMDSSAFGHCLQGQAFPEITLEGATYSPTNPYAGGGRPQAAGNQWNWHLEGFKDAVFNLTRMPFNVTQIVRSLGSGQGIPDVSDLPDQQQLIWPVWTLVPISIAIIASMAACCCCGGSRKTTTDRDRGFTLLAVNAPEDWHVLSENVLSPRALSGEQQGRALGDGAGSGCSGFLGPEPFLVLERDGAGNGCVGPLEPEPFLVPERELTPRLGHRRSLVRAPHLRIPPQATATGRGLDRGAWRT